MKRDFTADVFATSSLAAVRHEPRRIAVRTELVREHLVSTLLAEIDRQLADDVPEPVAGVLGRVVEAVPVAAPDGETIELARRGYLGRRAEAQIFQAARAP